VIDLPAGTMVEVARTRGVSEVMVMERAAKVPLRSATAWERFRFWWGMRRQSVESMSAATAAIFAINRAKGRERA
jgi:hypothetical protein